MNTFIFDIDGTLLDNVEGYLYGLQKTLRRHGREIAIQDLTWTNGRAGVDSLKELGFSPAEIPVVHEEWREDSKAFLNHVTWFPNMQMSSIYPHYKVRPEYRHCKQYDNWWHTYSWYTSHAGTCDS